VSADSQVREAGAVIASHLAQIEGLFKREAGVKITLIARSPGFPDGRRDLVITSDTIDDAIAALEKSRTAKTANVSPAVRS